MKIIFLDIDGVLSTKQWHKRVGDMHPHITCEDLIFQPSCMYYLKHILENTGACVVLSSDWKNDSYLRGVIDTNFVMHGISPKVIIGVTPVNISYSFNMIYLRFKEIQNWLHNYNVDIHNWDKVSEYVILDDLDLFQEAGDISFLKCNPYTGLTRRIAKDATRILNRKIKLSSSVLSTFPELTEK